MPAVALSRVVESGSGGQDVAVGTWQRLEALPDPRSPQGRIYPLACLIAIAVCAFTAAGNDRFTAVGQWIRRASQADLARLRARGTRSSAGTGRQMRKRSRAPWPGPCSGQARAAAAAPAGHPRSACAATMPGAPPHRNPGARHAITRVV